MCVEASGDFEKAIARRLYERDYRVIVVNPRRIKVGTGQEESPEVMHWCRATAVLCAPTAASGSEYSFGGHSTLLCERIRGGAFSFGFEVHSLRGVFNTSKEGSWRKLYCSANW